ncbi:MAG: FAD/NAD(P)-binding protein [Nanoarchaeota archaeon]|nr:FAD/NAD(P)-binding protein [Nanoarchaeota archaeon]
MIQTLVPRKVKVLHRFRETPDIVSLTLPKVGTCVPGQFYQLSVLGYGEAPISVASYTTKTVQFTIRQAGTVTNALANLKKGDTLYIRGPYGKGYPLKEYEGKNIILIGAGCGVATLRGVIDYIIHHRHKYNDVFLFFGYRNVNDIIFKKEAVQWKEVFNFKTALSKEKSTTCHDWTSGHITEVIEGLKLRTKNTGVFICGPPRMINDTVAILKKKGFTDEQLYLSTERLMYCGIGMCCHCMIRGKFTCKDGPVFRFDEIGYFKND